MIVTVDGCRVDPVPVPDVTLHKLIQHVRTSHLRNRLVISVALNGQVLDDETLSAELTAPVAANAQVDLESADSSALVNATLLELAQEFERAGAGFAETADRLSAGQAAAISSVGDFVRLWQTAYHALSQCGELLCRDLLAVRYNGGTVRDSLAQMVDRLTDVRDALDARDVVLQADLVRHELPVLASTWRELLSELMGQLAVEK